MSTPRSAVWVVAAVILAVPLPIAADNYLFYDQQPLAVISKQGEIERFSIGIGEGGMEIDKRIAKKIRKLWVYPKGRAPQRVDAGIEKSYAGCDEEMVVVPDHEHRNGLLSSKRLSLKSGALLDAATQSPLSKQEAGLLEGILRNKGVPQWQIARSLEKARMVRATILPKHGESLIVTLNDAWGDGSIAVLLIANSNGRGGYTLSLADVTVGGPDDSDGAAGKIDLILHADLNSDGIDEVLVKRVQYESFTVRLLKWSGNEWVEVAMSGGGC